jgi:hypothetical protein
MVKILLHHSVRILITLNLKIEAKAGAAQYQQKLASFFLYCRIFFKSLFEGLSLSDVFFLAFFVTVDEYHKGPMSFKFPIDSSALLGVR